MILSEQQYLRLVGIISAVIEATGARPARGCVSFAVAGSWILRQVHGLNAIPVAGAAFYRVDDRTGFTMAYGHYLQGEVISDETAFHSWVMCDEYVIDLAAPLIPENLILSGRPEKVPRRMFQRPMGEMSSSPALLMSEGDFYLEPNLPLSEKLFSAFLNDPTYLNLVEACADWYEQDCKEDTDSYHVPGQAGPQELRRHRYSLDGRW